MATTPRVMPTRGPGSSHAIVVPEGGWRRTFSALAIPQYRTLWWGMLASFMAMNMNMVARGYLAYDITGSATALGLVSLAWGGPMLVFSLFGGVVADRIRKVAILVPTQTAMGVLALITAVLVHLDIIQIWHLVALGVGQGTVFAFNMPARSALIPELVGPENVTNAIALNNAGQNASRIIGPASAGAMIGIPFIGMTGTFYFMAALYGVVVWSLLRLPRGRTPQRVMAPMMSEMRAGFTYIGGNSTLFMLIAMAFIPILLGMPYQTLMPVFQKDVLHVDSFGLGMLFTATGVGALIGSLLVASLSESRSRGGIQVVSGLMFGGALIGFALMDTFVTALLMIGVLGLASSIYMSLNNSMIMSYTDEDYYGRVMSVYMMTFSVMPLAAMPMGALADAFGAPVTVSVAGALIVVFIGALVTLVPAFRRIE